MFRDHTKKKKKIKETYFLKQFLFCLVKPFSYFSYFYIRKFVKFVKYDNKQIIETFLLNWISFQNTMMCLTNSFKKIDT